MQPNASIYMGQGFWLRATPVAGEPIMPTGFGFRGRAILRIHQHAHADAERHDRCPVQPQDYNAAIGMFFGPQPAGVGTGGNNAQVLLNTTDDFSTLHHDDLEPVQLVSNCSTQTSSPLVTLSTLEEVTNTGY